MPQEEIISVSEAKVAKVVLNLGLLEKAGPCFL
jgi:hypothetical protein